MRLRPRMLLVFAATVFGGMIVLFFLSRSLVLSSFLQLEDQQMKQNVDYALTGLQQEYSSLGRTVGDYAYWDRTYEFMRDPAHNDISGELQNGTLDGLGLNLVVLRDTQGKTAFAKFYEDGKEGKVPLEFLDRIFATPDLNPDRIGRMPVDGMVAFPDGIYLVSIRPILTSQRDGEPLGIFLAARRFDSYGATRVSDFTRTSVRFDRFDDPKLSRDLREAAAALSSDSGTTYVQPANEKTVYGYARIDDIFGKPLLILRVDTPRPIYERGKLSVLSLFATVFLGAVLSSLVILFFLQRFVLSRLLKLGREVASIGRRKASDERVQVIGSDELSSLSLAINEMLDELQKSHQQFLAVTENIHQIFWIREASSGRYEYVSGAFERVFGSSRSLLDSDPGAWNRTVCREDQAIVARALENQAAGKSAELYYRIAPEIGNVRWLWERSFPLFGSDGKLKHITGLTEDITDFKRTEEALIAAQTDLERRVAERTAELAERSELIKLLVDSAPGAMYGIGADGKCTFCNPAGLRLLGYSDVGEVLGMSAHQHFHHTRPDGSPYPQNECPVLLSFHNGQDTHVTDELYWRKDGTSFPVEYSSRPIRRDGKVVGAVVSFLDITDRKRQEMELRHGQKLEAVGRLAAGIAHEINTPIQFVSDNTRFLQTSFKDELNLVHKYQDLCDRAAEAKLAPELLKDIAQTRELADWDYLEVEIPRAMEQMLEGLSRVATIVRGMKEFSHVDRSNEKAPGDINRALESTLIVARNELKYVADVETYLGQIPQVVCHLGDLNQVFLNLLVNAAHSIEDVVRGTSLKGKIRVTTRSEDDWVEIAISDSGTGIPEEVRDKIFDPFFTTKAVGKGTGQGLALARAIVVEKHGGTLTFETETGKGTTFIVRLPLTGAALREEALVK